MKRQTKELKFTTLSTQIKIIFKMGVIHSFMILQILIQLSHSSWFLLFIHIIAVSCEGNEKSSSTPLVAFSRLFLAVIKTRSQ